MAAVTKLSTLGGNVCADSRANELWISRFADGTIQAGWLADISGSTAVSLDYSNDLDEFGGIALPRYDTDVDTAYTSSELIDIVIPQGGHLYNVKITNPAATIYAGEPLVFANGTVGELTKGGNIEVEHVARLFDDCITATTYATIIWGV